LTLTTHAYLARAAVAGVLDAVGAPAEERRLLAASGVGIFGHRLYLNEKIGTAIESAPALRRRILAASFNREVHRLAMQTSEKRFRTQAKACQPRAMSGSRRR